MFVVIANAQCSKYIEKHERSMFSWLTWTAPYFIALNNKSQNVLRNLAKLTKQTEHSNHPTQTCRMARISPI